jgi:23S rRNA (pseudouridine1915-N3)-methyltransferase
MRITIIAVGKLRDRAVAELAEKYVKRLPPGVKLEWIEVAAAPGKAGGRPARAAEAERLRARLPAGAHVAALTERGRVMDSMAFARWLGGLRDQGRDLCLLIGGADGLDPALIAGAGNAVSLSPLTFPHEMVRAILAEQIYRAFSILNNEPYHRQ